MGKFGTFSFHGSKTITTGEGGMFVTNDADLFERALTLSNHGRSSSQSKQFWSDVVGFKYKMSNIQAAIGCAQMERIEDLVKRKRQILKTYSQHLGILPNISMNLEPDGTVNGAWMPTVVFAEKNAVSRETLQSTFASENIYALKPLSVTVDGFVADIIPGGIPVFDTVISIEIDDLTIGSYDYEILYTEVI
jgi:perosamine synthetase